MIDCRHFYLACPPRTGSTWMMHALTACGLPSGSKAHIHLPHEGLTDKPRVVTVRHPCRWLRSFFSQIGRGALIDIAAFNEFQGLDEGTFDSFVRGYLERSPGAIGRMFDAYGGEVYLRVEDTPRNFYQFAGSLGVKADAALSLQPINAGRKLPIFAPDLYERVMAAEAEMLERFCYGAWS